MQDLDYKSAFRAATLKFEACTRRHQMIPAPDGCGCSCGWTDHREKTSECHRMWRQHVDTACITEQVLKNRGAT